MSLDVDLIKPKWVSYDEGKTFEKDENEILYSANITHNLVEMALEAGLYEALWRPHRLEETYDIPEDDHNAEWEFECNNTILAEYIVPFLEGGLATLKNDPVYFKKFNSPNGWGTYDSLVKFTENYLKACRENPKSVIKTDR